MEWYIYLHARNPLESDTVVVSVSFTKIHSKHTDRPLTKWLSREEITEETERTEEESDSSFLVTDADAKFRRTKPSNDSKFVTWWTPPHWEISRMLLRMRSMCFPRCTPMCRTVCPVLFTDVLFVVDLLSRDESELLRFVVVVVRTRRNRSRRRWSKKFVCVWHDFRNFGTRDVF